MMGAVTFVLIVCVVVMQPWCNAEPGSANSSKEAERVRRQFLFPTIPVNVFPAVPQNFIPVFHPCTPVMTRDDGLIHEIPSNIGAYFSDCGTTIYNTKRRDLLDLFKKDNQQTKRVVGGVITEPEGLWPWMVVVMSKNQGHVCTGSLIHPRWVLTAGHCFREWDSPCNYYVQIGENFIMDPFYAGDRQVIQVDKLIKNGFFTGLPDHCQTTPITHDIALLRLARPAILSKDVNTVCLLEPEEVFDASTCTIMGWGQVDRYGTRTNFLNHLTIPPMDWGTCANIKKSGYPLGNGQICLSNNNMFDACTGDSGGPYVCKSGTTNRWVQIGLTSYGSYPCATSQMPTVYTNTLAYLTWIQGAISRNGGI